MVYGPYYQRRSGGSIQAMEIRISPSGERKTRYLGIVGHDHLHWEGDFPGDLIDDLALAYWYAKSYRWARIRDPLLRLLKLIGAKSFTEEEIP